MKNEIEGLTKLLHLVWIQRNERDVGVVPKHPTPIVRIDFLSINPLLYYESFSDPTTKVYPLSYVLGPGSLSRHLQGERTLNGSRTTTGILMSLSFFVNVV